MAHLRVLVGWATLLFTAWACANRSPHDSAHPSPGDRNLLTQAELRKHDFSPDSPHRMMLGIPPQDRVLYSLEVRSHPLHAQRRIAPLEGIEDRQVTLVVAFPRPKDVQDEPLFLGKQVSQNIQ